MVYTNPDRRNIAGRLAVIMVRKNTKTGVCMSKRARFWLLLVALALIAAAVAALAFAMPDIASQRLQATLAPTLFTPPPP